MDKRPWRFIKSIIPVKIKRIPYYIFKSPQRGLGYFKTYKTETAGLIYWLFHGVSRKGLQPITICTGIKNRSQNYLDFVLASILKMAHQERIEIPIYDCNSDDIPRLEAKIRELWHGKLIFQHGHNEDFTRSHSFNAAIGAANTPIIFAADADISLPEDLVKQCNKFVSRKTVWFPIVFNLDENKPAIVAKENGEWLPVGKGMFACYKWQFELIGKFDLKFTSWGGEDWDIWFRFFKKGFLPLRTRCRGMFHHYHPSLKPSIPL